MPIGSRLGVFFYKLDPPHQLAGFELMGFNARVPDGSKPFTAMGRVGTETRKRITLKVSQGRGGAEKDVVCCRNKTYTQPLWAVEKKSTSHENIKAITTRTNNFPVTERVSR